MSQLLVSVIYFTTPINLPDKEQFVLAIIMKKISNKINVIAVPICSLSKWYYGADT